MSESDPSLRTPPSGGPPPPTIIIQQRLRGCGFWLGWFLAFVFFCAAGLFFLTVVVLSTSDLDTITGKKTHLKGALTEKTLDGTGADKVLVIPVTGIIGEMETDAFFYGRENMMQYVRQRLRAAREDADVKAVLLQVDSPGGGITASDVITQELRRFKKETGRPLVVCMGDVAASGGYYISMAADWIVAHPTTITGSIGVIMMNFDATLLLQKIGVQDRMIKSGPLKDVGSWTRLMTEEERQLLQVVVDQMLGRFVQVVAEGRNLPKEKVRELADGRIFTALQARDLKLLDQIGYYEDALNKTKELAKLTACRVVRYDKSFSFSALFDSEVESLRPGRAIEAALRDVAFPKGPRLMYLWTGR